MSAAAAPTPTSPRTAEPSSTVREDASWRPVMDVPCGITVDLSLPKFKVADFLGLHVGSIVDTHWNVTRDVPVRINGILVGWGELEGAGNRLAVRLTELA